MNKLIAVLSTIIFLFVAFWLGEGGRGLFQIYPYVIGLIGLAVISCLMFKKWIYRTFFSFLFVVFYLSAFYMGNLCFNQAYNRCVESAEQIRTNLSDYKTKNGRYPDELEDLNIPLPCSRYLRGTILEYESTASNYKIGFKDRLVEHSATDKEPFVAHK